ncbi:MAG: glycosyltransferase family 2 protein [Burkholderiales bacterium]|nr:glycosyltransferase family 2 protein [Burkholderiales bacterium]
MNKKITTIMAVLNREEYIAESIESVLAQTHPSDEIIVIDGGSTDGTLDVLSNYPELIVQTHTNLGVWESLNQGISLATGDYLSFIDSDDLWHKDKNKLQLQHMQNLNCDMSVCNLQNFANVAGNTVYTEKQVGAIYLGWFIEKLKFMEVGYFGTSLVAELMVWLQKARLMGLRECYLDDVLAYRRCHATNMTRSSAYNDGLVDVARELIRQRKLFKK